MTFLQTLNHNLYKNLEINNFKEILNEIKVKKMFGIVIFSNKD
jgi:hypothetical protein